MGTVNRERWRWRQGHSWAQLGTRRGPGSPDPPSWDSAEVPKGELLHRSSPIPVPPIQALSLGLFSFPGELQLTQFRKYSLTGGRSRGELGRGMQHACLRTQTSTHVLSSLVANAPARLANAFQTPSRHGLGAGTGGVRV